MAIDKPKIYLETTMFSFYHEEREHEEYKKYRAQVRAVFNRIKAGKYEPYTSILAIDEIMADTNQADRKQMIMSLITERGIQVLSRSDEVMRIANLYIQEGAVSSAHTIDAAHIAMAAVNGLDFIVSLNFAHIARTWTIERVRRVNGREGYQGIGIYRPLEVLEI